MALIKCKECKSEVSSKADACPRCGAKVKKSMGCGSAILLAFLIFIVVGIIGSSLSDSPSSSTSTAKEKASRKIDAPREKTAREIKQETKNALKLEWSWKKAGFDNIMEADFTITNNSNYDIKDIEILTLQYAKSGTQIDRNSRTIYEIVKAGETKKFEDFNMGFIHSQSNSANATITDFELIK